MLYTNKLLLILFFSSLFSACQEIAPVVPAIGDRKILIEEFTGVRCVNCPAGASEIENLRGIYGDRLIAVSIHAGDFAPPYSDSKFDFRTPEGTFLETFLGSAIGYPTAIINRKKFSGQPSLQVLRSTWAGFIANESKTPSVLSLGFVKNYNKTTRNLTLDLKIIPSENQTGDFRLTVMITENNILDTQETPTGKKSDYSHQHVLRKLVTQSEGDALGNLRTGETLAKSYAFTFPANWVTENCRIVAFVSKNGAEKDVLQVIETKILE